MTMYGYEIRNEYRLGAAELYKTAYQDDPEAILEGVAVAGLVGFLRQLGDLSEYVHFTYVHSFCSFLKNL